MSLELISTPTGEEIRHSERALALLFSLVAVALYAYLFSLFWSLLIKPATTISAVRTDDLVIFSFFALMLIFALGVTLFFGVYLTSTLVIQPEGFVIRKLFGLRLVFRVGVPFFFQVEKGLYRPDGATKAIKTFDLFIAGPAGRHWVTSRGSPENFVSIANSIDISIRHGRYL